MPKIVSIYSPKGGVGKTTGVTHIADCLATKYGLKVLVWDYDPQLSLYDSVVSNKASYKFDVTDRQPETKPDCDIFLVDFRPAAPFGDKGLTAKELKVLAQSDAIIVPTRIARMDMRSVEAVKKMAVNVPMLFVLNAIDLKNRSHAQWLSSNAEGEIYCGMAYRDVYSHTVDQYSTIYTNSNTTMTGQQAAKTEVEAIVEQLLKTLDPERKIERKYATVMPKFIARAKVAHAKFLKADAETNKENS